MILQRFVCSAIVMLIAAVTPTAWGAEPLSAPQKKAPEPVKLSRTGICHAPGSTYYPLTKNFTTFTTLEACLKAGGRMPRR